MAGRLGAAQSKLSFGDSAAQAGARPVWNLEIKNRKLKIRWCGCRELRPDMLLGGQPFCC